MCRLGILHVRFGGFFPSKVLLGGPLCNVDKVCGCYAIAYMAYSRSASRLAAVLTA